MFRRKHPGRSTTSQLYDQETFYRAYLHDVRICKRQLIVESPFITSKRVRIFLPIFRQLREHGVQIIVNTRDPQEHEGIYQTQAMQAVAQFQALDIVVLYTAGHHRKLAIIDGKVVWMGSLNILSFSDSCEIMTRTVSLIAAKELVNFIGIRKYLQDK
jgi:phosphatidylserine/phosphatidylglycerophosphate/cardiolipin synthase-like enzyme